VHDETAGALTLFALNRSLDEPMPLEVVARGFTRLAVTEARQMHHPDLGATNTKNQPNRVEPAPLAEVAADGALIRATLSPASWNVIRLRVGG
jgi:alpha-N-arabinofuranosidase